MFLKRKMNDSTTSYSDKILQIKEKIEEAEAVVIGAGAGFSTSAGFVYNGERFDKYFSDFRKKYGFYLFLHRSMLQPLFQEMAPESRMQLLPEVSALVFLPSLLPHH